MKIIISILMLIFCGASQAEESFDAREQKVLNAVESNPQVIEFVIYMSNHHTNSMFYFENDKTEQDKGKFDVYVGEDHQDHTVRYGAYSFNYPTRTLSRMNLVEGGDYHETEYNKLIFADIKVDSTYPGYSTKPLTDCMFQKRENFKAKERAWASSDNPQEHWIEAAFDKPVSLQKVMLFWAWDKGSYYESKDIRIFYLNLQGQETEIKDFKKTDDVIEKDWKVKGSDLQQTQWTFPAVNAQELVIKQGVGGGNEKRPNLMWVSQVWAY